MLKKWMPRGSQCSPLAAVPEGGAIMKYMGRGGDSLQMPRASCPHLIVYSIIKC